MNGINMVRAELGATLAAVHVENWAARGERWEDKEREAPTSKARRLCRQQIITCARQAAAWAQQIPEL